MYLKEKVFVLVAGIGITSGVIWLIAAQPYVLLASILGVLGWRALTGAR